MVKREMLGCGKSVESALARLRIPPPPPPPLVAAEEKRRHQEPAEGQRERRQERTSGRHGAVALRQVGRGQRRVARVAPKALVAVVDLRGTAAKLRLTALPFS